MHGAVDAGSIRSPRAPEGFDRRTCSLELGLGLDTNVSVSSLRKERTRVTVIDSQYMLKWTSKLRFLQKEATNWMFCLRVKIPGHSPGDAIRIYLCTCMTAFLVLIYDFDQTKSAKGARHP